eukprot:Pgem_evm1s4672
MSRVPNRRNFNYSLSTFDSGSSLITEIPETFENQLLLIAPNLPEDINKIVSEDIVFRIIKYWIGQVKELPFWFVENFSSLFNDLNEHDQLRLHLYTRVNNNDFNIPTSYNKFAAECNREDLLEAKRIEQFLRIFDFCYCNQLKQKKSFKNNLTSHSVHFENEIDEKNEKQVRSLQRKMGPSYDESIQTSFANQFNMTFQTLANNLKNNNASKRSHVQRIHLVNIDIVLLGKQQLTSFYKNKFEEKDFDHIKFDCLNYDHNPYVMTFKNSK